MLSLLPALAALAAWSLPATAATHAAGAVIENAATVDVTPGGFDAMAGLLPALVPGTVDIPETGGSSGGSCWLGGYEYDLSNGWVGVEVDSASLTPQDGYLDLTANMKVWVNDSSDRFNLYYSVECLDDTCHGHIDPFDAQVTGKLYLTVVTGSDGTPTLNATVSDLAVTYDLTSDQITLEDCSIGTVEDVLNFFGLSLYDFLLGQADSYIQDAVANAVPDLEQQIEDAFAQATIDQQLSVGDATVDVNLYPADVTVTPAGARISMNGSVVSEDQAACIADFDPGGSVATASDPPDLGSAPSGVPSDYHVALDLSDDFGDQALYAIWQAGALCYQLTPDTSPVPLDTSVLGLLAGNAYDDLFPESEPMEIVTSPQAPPTLDFGGSHDLDVNIQDLDLDFYAELDGRMARVLSLGLQADAGVDLALDSNAGTLGVNVDVSSDNMTATVIDNQFVPDANSEIESSFSSVFDTLVGQLLDSYLQDMTYALPAYDGFGLTDLQVAQAGAAGDWLGAYAWIGTVPYTGSGCGGSGSSSGCGGGCASGGSGTGPWMVFGLPLAVALVRRRR